MPIQVFGGGFGIDQDAPAFTIDTVGRNRYISVSTSAWLHIFQQAAVVYGDLAADQLGLYTFLLVDGHGKAKFAFMKTPQHGFRPRQNGCVWNPNGSIRLGLTEIDTCPIERQAEQCPDAYWNSCFESLFAGGRGVRDLNSSPELQQLLAMTYRQLALGMGNDYHNLVHFASHPLIEAADAAGTYLADDDAWDAYYAQMIGSADRPNNCSGIVTIIDGLSDAGEPGYDNDIPDSDIDAAGKYTGDVVALFEQLKNSAKPALKAMANNGTILADGTRRYPILLVSASIYNAYKEYLRLNFNNTETMLRYFVTGIDAALFPVPGVLDYEGLPVVRWDASGTFDSIVGTQSHRAALVAPGTFGIASDVLPLMQYDGMGLVSVQKLDPPDNGKIYMDTTLRWGAALADKDFVTYARNINPS